MYPHKGQEKPSSTPVFVLNLFFLLFTSFFFKKKCIVMATIWGALTTCKACSKHFIQIESLYSHQPVK